MQFVVLSDANATDFNSIVKVPVFTDPGAGQPAWNEMEPGAVKHDTFVFSRAGVRTLVWDASSRSFNAWGADIRAAVVAQGK